MWSFKTPFLQHWTAVYLTIISNHIPVTTTHSTARHSTAQHSTAALYALPHSGSAPGAVQRCFPLCLWTLTLVLFSMTFYFSCQDFLSRFFQSPTPLGIFVYVCSAFTALCWGWLWARACVLWLTACSTQCWRTSQLRVMFLGGVFFPRQIVWVTARYSKSSFCQLEKIQKNKKSICVYVSDACISVKQVKSFGHRQHLWNWSLVPSYA